MSKGKGELIAISFKKEGATSLRGPTGLKKAMDELLGDIKTETGVKVSRNEFIMNAIRHYLEYLHDSEDIEELVKRIKLSS